MTMRTGATRPNDGIIDEVAVDRFINGEASMPLSPAEVLTVIRTAAAQGMDDYAIAALFGRGDKSGANWVHVTRTRNGFDVGSRPRDIAIGHIARFPYLAGSRTERGEKGDAMTNVLRSIRNGGGTAASLLPLASGGWVSRPGHV